MLGNTIWCYVRGIFCLKALLHFMDLCLSFSLNFGLYASFVKGWYSKSQLLDTRESNHSSKRASLFHWRYNNAKSKSFNNTETEAFPVSSNSKEHKSPWTHQSPTCSFVSMKYATFTNTKLHDQATENYQMENVDTRLYVSYCRVIVVWTNILL